MWRAARMEVTVRFGKPGRIWIGIFGGLAIVAAALVFFAIRPVERHSATVASTRAAQAVGQFFVPSPQAVFGKDRVRVLLVGLDYDYNKLDEETSKQSRSDIIMAIDLDLKNRHVAELSIPRDMVAVMPDGKTSKINAAQSEGGIRESEAVVAKWLGVPGFDRYVVLRIDTAKDLINALGGVNVNVMNSAALKHSGPNGPVDYDDNWGHLHIHLKPGLQHLDGENAVAYARFRHDWCSDPCRIMRQQQLIHAVVDRIEHDKLNTLTHIQALLAVVRNDVDTNFTPREQLSTAVAYASLKPADIATAQVPYTSTVDLPGEGDSLVADEVAKARLVAATFGHSAPPIDVAKTLATPVAPSAIRISVQNGTHVPGLAARIAANLRAQGFVITEVADARSRDVRTTEIHGRSSNAPALEAVRKALGNGVPPSATMVDAPATTDPGNVTIVLGHDITASVPEPVAPAP